MVGDMLSSKPALPLNCPVLGERVPFCPESYPEESVDESKPFLKDGIWQLCLIKSDGSKETHFGKIQSASRRTERSILIFDLGLNRKKKYYLCEFCRKQGETGM